MESFNKRFCLLCIICFLCTFLFLYGSAKPGALVQFMTSCISLMYDFSKQSIKYSCCAISRVCSITERAWNAALARSCCVGDKKWQEVSALFHMCSLKMCSVLFLFFTPSAWCNGWNTAERSIANYASTDLLSRQVSKSRLSFTGSASIALDTATKALCGPSGITVLSASVLKQNT